MIRNSKQMRKGSWTMVVNISHVPCVVNVGRLMTAYIGTSTYFTQDSSGISSLDD